MIAITEALDGKNVDWQESVSDAQYGVTRRAGAEAPTQPTRAHAHS